MNTWRDQDPPVLPPATLLAKIRGGVRLVALLAITLVGVILFLLGRGLRAVLGRWVVFHFGVARLWCRASLWICGLSLHVTGRPITHGSLVANHSSWLDIVSLRSTRLIYFVAKSEVANWPGIGFITRITGTVFIERRRSHAKLQEQILRDRMAADQLLCFFPEGTSTDGLRVLPFKSSLFSAFFDDGQGADIEIQPVSVRYLPSPRMGMPDDFFGWWGDMGFEGHMWDVLCRSSGGRAEVIFHDAVPASAFRDRKALAEYSQRAVAHGVAAGAPAALAPPANAGQSA